MTDNVWVPRELLLELRDSAYVEAQHYHAAMKGYLQHEHDRLDRIVADADALLAQPVASEPVAWQWLGTAHFRRKIPKYANACHWDPLHRHPPAPAIPDGYALVPIEPTQKMLEAGWVEERDIQQNEDTAWDFRSCNRLLNIYRAMIAIAQQPTTEGSTDE